MIRFFEVDTPTSIVEILPTAQARVIDLMMYLCENKIRYVGEPMEVQKVSVLDAIALDPDPDIGEYEVTILMRARTREEVRAASRMQ